MTVRPFLSNIKVPKVLESEHRREQTPTTRGKVQQGILDALATSKPEPSGLPPWLSIADLALTIYGHDEPTPSQRESIRRAIRAMEPEGLFQAEKLGMEGVKEKVQEFAEGLRLRCYQDKEPPPILVKDVSKWAQGDDKEGICALCDLGAPYDDSRSRAWGTPWRGDYGKKEMSHTWWKDWVRIHVLQEDWTYRYAKPTYTQNLHVRQPLTEDEAGYVAFLEARQGAKFAAGMAYLNGGPEPTTAISPAYSTVRGWKIHYPKWLAKQGS